MNKLTWFLLESAMKPIGNLALNMTKEGNNTTFILYDPKTVQVKNKHISNNYTGILTAHLEDCYRCYRVAWVEAQEGYGPLLYKIAMQYAGYKGLAPDGDPYQTSPDAIKVWQRFYEDAKAGRVPIKLVESKIRSEGNYIPKAFGIKNTGCLKYIYVATSQLVDVNNAIQLDKDFLGGI